MSRLLVIDDERALRETLRDHLAELGYEVMAVESASAALNRIEAFSPDLVLTDVQMPGMSGFELLGHLRANRPGTDVVIFTGHADVEGAINAMKSGASDYLIKPLDLMETEEVIERCLAKRQSVTEDDASGRRVEVDPAHGLVGRHPAMVQVYKAIGAVAATDAAVLLRGETGTGKELVARAIHQASPLADQPFVGVNCAAVPTELLESELFGHVRGAFTGASADRRGKFDVASGGILFLDEIGDTSLAFQAKLLRVLQEREYYPVGGDKPRRTSARIIAATHRPLQEMVEDGSFRQDLFFRLQVIEIAVPPLRERRSDIPLLVRYLLARAAAGSGLTPPVVPAEVMEHLAGRDWPGNVRELENVITRAVVMSRGPALTLQDVGGTGNGASNGAPHPCGTASLSEVRSSVERQHVQRVLMESSGNKTEAARVLGISRPTLNRIIRDHRLVVP
ncbi:MAG TPA: sigma-54 dependent transcriptional regulator [Longimicrobiales bacterium]|nr:sigma-54 dependent transcriptional regulator [Longimicrobiales bacterium]